MAIIETIKASTNCHILLALKGFATYHTFSSLHSTLNGVTASSLYEARLGLEEFKKDIHVYCVAMTPMEAKQLNTLATHISFNSKSQLQLFLKNVAKVKPSLGLRINPEIGESPTEKYNPCGQYSRLGIPISQLTPSDFDAIDGIHFHALCEQYTPALFQVLEKIEHRLGPSLHHLKWINWGGGHRLTDHQYDIQALIAKINEWEKKYDVQIIMEPGEAIAKNCGYYVTQVLDIINNQKDTAICDISATAHMPDVLEYPYRPEIINASIEDDYKYTYIIGGNTCLAGDIIGTYSFKEPLKVNDPLIFTDMGHYTIVKTSNFNGVKQPSIGMIKESGEIKMIMNSSYFNFKERLS